MKKRLVFSMMIVLLVVSVVWGGNVYVNGGFENLENTSGGLPVGYYNWNGDYSQIVGSTLGINPNEGSYMLQFKGAGPNGAATTAECIVWKLVDTSGYSELIQSGNAVAQASSRFNRIQGNEQTDTLFGVVLYAFSGSYSNFPYFFSNGIYLARIGSDFESDGDFLSWESTEVTLILPVNTTFLALGVRVTEDVYNDLSYPEFDGHFADSVSLTISSLSPLESLEITGPNEVAEEFWAQYKAIAHYENGSEADVTGSADWLVEPNDNANISAGLLETGKIDLPEDVIIYAQYTEGDITAGAEKAISILAVCPSGSALEFDGVDDYVIADIGTTTGNISYAFWFKSDNVNITKRIVTRDWSNGGSFTIAHLANIGGKLEAIFRYSNGIQGPSLFSNPILSNKWYYVSCVYDGSNVKFYLNGLLVDQAEQTSIIIDNKPIYIGAKNYDYKGEIDEVSVFSRALSAEEIQELMYSRPDIEDPNLAGYWDFNEGEGQVAYDLSGNGNDGQLGTSPAEDDGDPKWVDSVPPVGICTLEWLVERNLNRLIDIKQDILEQLEAAVVKERMLLRFLNISFRDRDFGTASKSDMVKAKQKILSAMFQEILAAKAVEKSIEKLYDALEALGIGEE